MKLKLKTRKRQEEPEELHKHLLRKFIKYKEWIGLLVYPFLFLLPYTLCSQSSAIERLLKLQLQPGVSPSVPVNEQDLQEIYYQNAADILSLIFFESDSTFEALKDFEDQRMDMLENFDNQSPWKGFVQAEIKLQWAFIKLKYGEEWGAFWSLRSANRLLNDQMEAYPDFQLNHRTNGLLNVLFGITPDNYQWIFKLFGMTGSVRFGIEELNRSVQFNSYFGLENQILLGFIYSHLLEDFQKAPGFIEEHTGATSPIAQYFQGIILQKTHRAKEARDLWLSPESTIPFKSYLIAESYFQEGQYEQSIPYFQEFLNNFKGTTYTKDTELKLGLAFQFIGNDVEAQKYLNLARKNETSSSEVDKNASQILEKLASTNKTLLKLRYAIDGGYYQIAEVLIKQLVTEPLNEKERIELIYRQARMTHLQQIPEQATQLYFQVIQEEKTISDSYFAPNSFLQLGYLKRDFGNYEAAKEYFNKVLDFKKHPYETSLDSKAKVALSLLNVANE